MHTKTVVPMAVSRQAIMETEEFKNLERHAGKENAITMSLTILGMDLSTLTSNYGLVRTLTDRNKLFFDWVYTGTTRANFPEKNIYDTVPIILPKDIPSGVETYDLSTINHEDVIYEELVQNAPQKKRVKTPTYSPTSEL